MPVGNNLKYQNNQYQRTLGSYFPFRNVISFPAYKLSEMTKKLKYNLSYKKFIQNISIIEEIMTFQHEHTHFFQHISTSNGFYLLECHSIFINTLLVACSKLKYKLPLIKFIESLPDILTDLSPEYANFFCGYSYKFLVDWNQGSNKHIALKMAVSDVGFDVLLKKLELLNDDGDQELGLTAKFIPQVFIADKRIIGKENYLAYSILLGSNSIMESFAKSVEYEHLLWFNKKGGQRYIDVFEKDPDNLIYFLPIKLLFRLASLDYFEHDGLLFTLFRILCDISLMYNDNILKYYDIDFTKNFDEKYFYTETAQPGVTFLRALKALPNIPPLKDQNGDLLRFYDNLCEEIGAPSQNEMTERALIAVKNRLNRFSNGIQVKLYENFLHGFTLRKEYPLFFINDLIYSDKCEIMRKKFEGILQYMNDDEYIISDDNYSSVHMTYANDIFEQMLHETTVSCPIIKRSPKGKCPYYHSECSNSFPSSDGLSDYDCLYFNMIEPFKDNASKE